MSDDRVELNRENILNREILLEFLERRAGEAEPQPLDVKPQELTTTSPDQLALRSLIDIYIAGGCSYRLITQNVESRVEEHPILVVDLDEKTDQIEEEIPHEIISPSKSRWLARQHRLRD